MKLQSRLSIFPKPAGELKPYFTLPPECLRGAARRRMAPSRSTSPRPRWLVTRVLGTRGLQIRQNAM
eukprot:272509-Prymnesium_polylepis.1